MGIFTRFFLDTLLYCPARGSSQYFVYSFCILQEKGYSSIPYPFREKTLLRNNSKKRTKLNCFKEKSYICFLQTP